MIQEHAVNVIDATIYDVGSPKNAFAEVQEKCDTGVQPRSLILPLIPPLQCRSSGLASGTCTPCSLPSRKPDADLAEPCILAIFSGRKKRLKRIATPHGL